MIHTKMYFWIFSMFEENIKSGRKFTTEHALSLIKYSPKCVSNYVLTVTNNNGVLMEQLFIGHIELLYLLNEAIICIQQKKIYWTQSKFFQNVCQCQSGPSYKVLQIRNMSQNMWAGHYGNFVISKI